MKKCTICKLEKKEAEYSKNRCRNDGLQNVCKNCNALRSRQYYLEKTDEHRETTKLRRNKKRLELKKKIDELRALCGCAKCGEQDYVCIDFHHTNPEEKDFNVSMSTSYEWPWSKVLEEVLKCVCLCASCHRKLHAGRFVIEPSMLCQIALETKGYETARCDGNE